MAEVSNVGADGCREVKSSQDSFLEPGATGPALSRVKLLDTMVDTFLKKLIAAGSYQRFTECYKRFSQLQSEMSQRIYDKFVTQLQTSILEEIAEIKTEGNLEAVLNALDVLVEEGKDRKEPALVRGADEKDPKQDLSGKRAFVGERPSGVPEGDLRSPLLPYYLRHRDALRRLVQKQESENRQLAEQVLAGRRQVEELQLQCRARRQAWQTLHREQKELLAVLQEPERNLPNRNIKVELMAMHGLDMRPEELGSDEATAS